MKRLLLVAGFLLNSVGFSSSKYIHRPEQMPATPDWKGSTLEEHGERALNRVYRGYPEFPHEYPHGTRFPGAYNLYTDVKLLGNNLTAQEEAIRKTEVLTYFPLGRVNKEVLIAAKNETKRQLQEALDKFDAFVDEHIERAKEFNEVLKEESQRMREEDERIRNCDFKIELNLDNCSHVRLLREGNDEPGCTLS